MDICWVAGTARAPYASRISTYDKGLTDELKTAIAVEGLLWWISGEYVLVDTAAATN